MKTITLENMNTHRISTGHRDCCGDMIHEGDTVFTWTGEAVVTTTEKRWFLSYPDGRLEPLNDYGSGVIRRCDNSRVTTNIVTETGVTTKSIVTRLSHGLSQPEGGQGQVIKCVL